MSAFPDTPKTLLSRMAAQVTGESEASWVRFFDLYQPVIRKFAESVGAKGEAEDITQDVFVKLVEVFRKGAYKPDRGRFRAYLATLIRREVVNRWHKAQPLVAELMAPTMDEFKAKKKTAAEVADMAVKYAGEAETEAAKFMLYRSSIPYYVRGEAYDKAADAVVQLKANVKDVPAEVVAEIISKATVRANKEKAPRLFELYQQAKTQATAEKDVKELRKKPASTTNKRKLAEALATTGNWQDALKEFASLTDQTAQMAKGEQDGSAKSAALGEFWWSYKPTYENAEDTFRIHAAAHYRKALAAGEITGLKKNIVEQRIKEYGGANESFETAEEKKLTYEGYLPRANTLLWKGVSLNDIQEFSATFGGKSIREPFKVLKVSGRVVKSGEGWKSVQFQVVDGWLKCVQARFEQKDDGVHGFVEKAEYASGSIALGTDFSKIESAKEQVLCCYEGGQGYGIKDLQVTVGKKQASGVSVSTTLAVAKVREAKGNEATQTPAAKDLYCVIDLSGGSDAKKYPVSYLSDMPKGGWSDEYKTTKLVLRRVESGTFRMGKPGDSRRVEISKPFYVGVFEVTQKQWDLVMDDRPSFWKGPHWQVRPVEGVSYIRTRGNNAGLKWPESDEVDSDSFFGRIRQKTGLRFDLPTEAQWEYACRAGTETDYNNGCDKTNSTKDSAMDKIGRYGKNGGWDEDAWGLDFSKADRNCETNFGTAAVGSYQPNRWGLFDMSGNVHEQCLDRGEGKSVILRGGNWWSPAIKATSWFKHGTYYDKGRPDTGFRLVLVSEWKEKQNAGGGAKSALSTTTPTTGSIELKTGGNSPFTVNGNVATLKLANGEKIEFVQCPPGEFKMLKGYEKNASTVKVKISRPFWIARKRMTRGQRGAIAPNVPKLQPSAGNENVTFEGNVRNADEEMLLRRLTDDFGKSLPAGYVFRLPSIAEYEYAYHANTKDWNDPYIYDDFANVNKGTVEKMRAKDDDSLANAWGLLAMANLNALMDRFPIAFAGGQRRYDERMKGIELAEGTTDPFFWCEEDAYPMTACWGNFNMRCLHNGRAYRLVIGPDLVSEWKAKNAKK